MTNKDIYVSAMKHIGESCDVEGNEDYEERAPYLIATFCSEASELEAAYREAHSLPTPTKRDAIRQMLECEFPMCDEFASAATLYLAAMLIVDENPELSDKLFDRYCCRMATIQSSIPSRIEKIAQKYGA